MTIGTLLSIFSFAISVGGLISLFLNGKNEKRGGITVFFGGKIEFDK